MLPADAELIDLNRPEHAAAQLADLLGALREPTARAELESLAHQVLDEVTHGGGYLLAVLTGPDTQPAVLTGVTVPSGVAWSAEQSSALRWALEDVGGAGVTDTAVLDTALGPVAIAERAPTGQVGGDQRTWQLQAFVPEPGSPDLLALTLSAMSPRGWASHRAAFVDMIGTATSD